MSGEAEESLIDIPYERQQSQSGSYFEIFWYHWPRDGVFPWEDYEPVVFAYNRNHDLCFVLVRRAWKFIIMNPDEVFWPPEVLFKGGSHHQFVRMTTDDFGDFEQSNLQSLKTLNVTSSSVTLVDSAHLIPDFNIGGPYGSIYRKIMVAMSQSCES